MSDTAKAGKPRFPTEMPEWVKEMHRYRAKHGHFKGEDVRRVLGDQTRSVRFPMKEPWPASRGGRDETGR